MKVENGKIVEATRDELWKYWLSRGWCDFYSFDTYVRLCQNAGTKVTDEKDRPD